MSHLFCHSMIAAELPFRRSLPQPPIAAPVVAFISADLRKQLWRANSESISLILGGGLPWAVIGADLVSLFRPSDGALARGKVAPGGKLA